MFTGFLFLNLKFASSQGCGLTISGVNVIPYSTEVACENTHRITVTVYYSNALSCDNEKIKVIDTKGNLLCEIPVNTRASSASCTIDYKLPNPSERSGAGYTVFAVYGNQKVPGTFYAFCPNACNAFIDYSHIEPLRIDAKAVETMTIEFKVPILVQSLKFDPYFCEKVDRTLRILTPEGNEFCKVVVPISLNSIANIVACKGEYRVPQTAGKYYFRFVYGNEEQHALLVVEGQNQQQNQQQCNLALTKLSIEPKEVDCKKEKAEFNATIYYTNAENCKDKTVKVYAFGYPGREPLESFAQLLCEAKINISSNNVTCKGEINLRNAPPEIYIPFFAIYQREGGKVPPMPIVVSDNVKIVNCPSDIAEEQNESKEQKQTFDLNLKKGWNLVSIPLKNFKIEENTCNIKAIFYYDAEKEKFVKVKVEDLEFGKGYWFYVNSSCKIKVSGDVVNNLDDFPRLYKGWNLIGSLKEKINVYEYRGDCEIKAIFYYDAANKKWVKTNELVPGYGHFIYTANNCKLGEGLPPPPPSGQ